MRVCLCLCLRVCGVKRALHGGVSLHTHTLYASISTNTHTPSLSPQVAAHKVLAAYKEEVSGKPKLGVQVRVI